ncbi:MAG TPA: tripartite tricarboxylate transporter substrate-binding protein, partial [Acetobacteraceae bacterium]
GVKPFTELGFPGFSALTYWALLGPAGIPAPITQRMQRTVATALQDPVVRTRMEEQGADIVGSTPAECAAFIRGEAEKWGAVIRDNGIRAEG